MRRKPTLPLALLTLTAFSACGGQPPLGSADTDAVQSRLESSNGGYQMVDESPAFGDAAAFAEAGVLEPMPEVFDEMTELPEVETLMGGDLQTTSVAPGVAPGRRFVLVALWGQMRLDRSVPTPTNWSGQIAVTQGAVVARRTIRFDPEDALLPRIDPRLLPFRSFTQPHHDGLVVNVYENAAADPGVQGAVVLQLGHLDPIAIPYDTLDGFRLRVTVDSLGNEVMIAAEEIPRTACAAGFLLGRWHRLAPGLGVFLGQWAGAAGELHGHLAGIYGRRPSTGEQVFFGKYIGMAGEARGILTGTYADGRFDGLWLGANGPRGVLGGLYRESIPGPETGGFFLGGWAQTQCAQ